MEYLFSIFWKNYRIGYIFNREKKFVFFYDTDGLKEASIEGFDFLIGFPEINKIYINNTMFPIFSYRIKTKERLKRDNIKYNNDLTHNSAKLITDNISIIYEKDCLNDKRIQKYKTFKKI